MEAVGNQNQFRRVTRSQRGKAKEPFKALQHNYQLHSSVAFS